MFTGPWVTLYLQQYLSGPVGNPCIGNHGLPRDRQGEHLVYPTSAKNSMLTGVTLCTGDKTIYTGRRA
jgi:hypothetical protein